MIHGYQLNVVCCGQVPMQWTWIWVGLHKSTCHASRPAAASRAGECSALSSSMKQGDTTLQPWPMLLALAAAPFHLQLTLALGLQYPCFVEVSSNGCGVEF